MGVPSPKQEQSCTSHFLQTERKIFPHWTTGEYGPLRRRRASAQAQHCPCFSPAAVSPQIGVKRLAGPHALHTLCLIIRSKGRSVLSVSPKQELR